MRRLNPAPWLRSHPFLADWFLAGAVLVGGIIGLFAPGQKGVDYRNDDILVVLLVLLSSLPLAWRRRMPFDVLIVVGVSSVLIEALHYYSAAGGLGAMIALYSVGAHTTDRRRSQFGLAFTLVGVLIVYASAPTGFELGGLVSNFILFSTAWILGDNLQTRRAAPAWTTITLTLWATTSCSSRAMRVRSALTACRASSWRAASESTARSSSERT